MKPAVQCPYWIYDTIRRTVLSWTFGKFSLKISEAFCKLNLFKSAVINIKPNEDAEQTILWLIPNYKIEAGSWQTGVLSLSHT